MLIVKSVRHERTRGKQCTVVLSSIYLRPCASSLYRIGHPSQAGGRTGGQEGLTPVPTHRLIKARHTGTEGEVGASEADQAAIGQRYGDAARAGCLIRFRAVISVCGLLCPAMDPKGNVRCLSCPSLIGWPPHSARLLNLGSITSHLSLKALWHGHGSSLHGEEGKALRKKQRYLLDIFAVPNDK